MGALVVTGLDRAVLRAVFLGRGLVVCGPEPVLLIDGELVPAVGVGRALIGAGLVVPALPGRPGMGVLAVLTDAGRAALDVTGGRV